MFPLKIATKLAAHGPIFHGPNLDSSAQHYRTPRPKHRRSPGLLLEWPPPPAPPPPEKQWRATRSFFLWFKPHFPSGNLKVKKAVKNVVDDLLLKPGHVP